jgi:two-component system chemotaxis response regulator CheY
MIVDDSLVARRMLRKILTEGGHEVVCEASDGASAIGLFRRHQPDLVTMDINMPRMDGLHASEHIRAEFPDARIIVVTSINSSEEVHHAFHVGAVRYLLKPFQKERVLEALATALHS